MWGQTTRIIWKNVPTTININGGKTITIAVDNKKTNFHFAGQPILGVVTSMIPCSQNGMPGPNPLPSCGSLSNPNAQAQTTGISNSFTIYPHFFK
jgi:hypothetical protein